MYYLQSRYYNPDWGRFLNADFLAGTPGGLLTTNVFAYTQNNPVNHSDPNGDYIVDVGFLAMDVGDFLSHPSKKKAAWIGLDLISFADPTGGMTTALHVVSGVKKAEKAVQTVRRVNKGTKKPMQIHHYETNKSKKYNLNLDYGWNKELLPHQGRHPNAYHDYVLNNLRTYDELAKGNTDNFLKLFEWLKAEVRNNPEMLYKGYWRVK